MIIAVTFLGILMQVFAEECELSPPAENFDPQIYLNIEHAYVTHSKEGPKEAVCREYRTTKNSDGTSKTVVTSDYKIGGASRKSELDCTDTPKGTKPGQFSVECVVRGNTTKIQLETSVMATDNKNYALLQTCTKTGTGIADNVLVLQTKKDSVEEGVKSVFKDANWSLEKWYSRKNIDCDDIKE
uniref:Pc19, similar to pallidipin n=1 Tax=Panstrongylus chinai TaxID=156444 RepID=A0A286T330_9HEMI|nr:Pc19, similar to pallidipin [Panstrongylus chinai]